MTTLQLLVHLINTLYITHSSNIQNTQIGMEVLEYGNVTLTGGEILSKLNALPPEWRKDDNTGPSNEDSLLDWLPGNELSRKPDIVR